MKGFKVFLIALLLLGSAGLSACSFPRALIPNLWFIEWKSTSAPLADAAADQAEGDLSVIPLYLTVEGPHSLPDLITQDNGIDEIAVSLRQGEEFHGAGSLRLSKTPEANPMENSYHISLSADSPDFFGSRALNLNRTPGDITYGKSKLAFDLFRRVGNLAGMHTRFVDLYIRHSADPSGAFVRYGIFTNVEEPDGSFLRRHGLDPDGGLYKAKFFEFSRIVGSTDQETAENFDVALETKSGDSNLKLFNMLADVSDPRITDTGILNKSFQKDNYFTYLAVNILIGNYDASAKNYLLYTPTDSMTWYFLPWDDGTSFSPEYAKAHRAPWREGVTAFWGSELHRRFLSRPKNLEALSAKIEELKHVITPELVRKLLLGYYDALSGYIDTPREEVLAAIEKIAAQPQRNIDTYYASLKKPVPVFTSGPLVRDDMHYFNVDSSHIPAGGGVYYDFVLARDPALQDVIERIDATTQQDFFVNLLPPGTYYYRIRSFNEAGIAQLTFDQFYDGPQIYYGINQCVVQ